MRENGIAAAPQTKRRDDNGSVRGLVERAQRGDRLALEELYLLHFDRIYSYLHMSVGSRHDAEDLTTQTFVKMLEAIGRFQWRSVPFSAWLFRIAHNGLTDLLPLVANGQAQDLSRVNVEPYPRESPAGPGRTRAAGPRPA